MEKKIKIKKNLQINKQSISKLQESQMMLLKGGSGGCGSCLWDSCRNGGWVSCLRNSCGR